MDKPFVQPKHPLQQSLLLAIAIVLAIAIACAGLYWHRMSEPYVHSVLSLEGSVRRGRDIFQINCAACHGITGTGQVGPSLRRIAKRKSKFDLIHQVTDGKTPPMPMFQPTPQEMADLLEYLHQL
ncbi:MAG: cytochrome c [Cyanobacteriota bacterium]|nr:cytochrome c [Cyanobacteriota bacterium]